MNFRKRIFRIFTENFNIKIDVKVIANSCDHSVFFFCFYSETETAQRKTRAKSLSKLSAINSLQIISKTSQIACACVQYIDKDRTKNCRATHLYFSCSDTNRCGSVAGVHH